jgi:hypothetical protein
MKLLACLLLACALAVGSCMAEAQTPGPPSLMHTGPSGS